MKESERYIVMDGCMFLNKCPTKMCLAKKYPPPPPPPPKKKKKKKNRRRNDTDERHFNVSLIVGSKVVRLSKKDNLAIHIYIYLKIYIYI